MYQSESFQIKELERQEEFCPSVISAYKVFADSLYFHYCDETEKENYGDGAYAFIRCTEGQGKFCTCGGEFILKENECVLLKISDIQKYASKSELWGYRWVNFKIKNAPFGLQTGKIYSVPFGEQENSAFGQMLSCGKTYPLNSSYLNALFTVYFYSVMRQRDIKDSALPAAQNKLIDEMCAYISQKIYSRISVEETAAFFQISPRRLHQIFTKELNLSPKQYILKKKMEEGYKILVKTSTPVNKIAEILAFSSPYHFTNEFKKTFGMSPKEVRKIQNGG